jgi:hypothetical protein
MGATSTEVEIAELRAVVRAVRTPAFARECSESRHCLALAVLVIFALILGFLHSGPVRAWFSTSGHPWRKTEESVMRAGIIGRSIVASSSFVRVGAVSAETRGIDGYVQVADSAAEFSPTQGGNGWWYRFDRGDGTVAQDMQHYFYSYEDFRWCATATYGGSSTLETTSHCTLTSANCHTNSGPGCATPTNGVLRPIREWRSAFPQLMKAHVRIEAASDAQRFELLVDGSVVWSHENPVDGLPARGLLLELPFGSSIALRTTPIGYCAGSSHWIEIYAQDCNGDGMPDANQIRAGELVDANANNIPDCCEESVSCSPCPGDIDESGTVNGVDLAAVLTVWGSDGGKYPRADTNNDGEVNGADLATMLGSWGPCE